MKNQFDILREWFDTEEGKASLEKSRIEDELRKAHEERWIEKFRQWAEPDMNAAIERLIKWYESDEYVKREYKIGYEPRETLLWLAWEYARKYCKLCDDEKYYNSFTGGAYYIGGYVISIMHGQGSILRIEKLKTKKPRASKKDRVIKMIEDRITSEYKKHHKSSSEDWIKIAAEKIYTTIQGFQ